MTVRGADGYFTIRPNWDGGMSRTFGWRTTIQTVIEGGEKRSSLQTWVRLGLKYKVDALTANESAYLKRKLFRYLYGLYGIPIWTEQCILSSEAASAQRELNVGSTTDKFFAEGDKVVILHPEYNDVYEIGIIDTITTTLITLESNLNNTWAQGCEVYPLLIGRLRITEELNFINDGICRMDVQVKEAFELTEGSYTTTTTTSTTTTTTTTTSTTTTTTTTT